MSLATIEKNLYATFAPAERVVLLLKAMARRDEEEAQRLRSACPRRTYTQSDAEFMERMNVAFDTAAVVCADLQLVCGSLKLLYWAKGTVEAMTTLSTFVAEMAFHEGMGCMQGTPQSMFFVDEEQRDKLHTLKIARRGNSKPIDPAVGWEEVDRRAEAIEVRAKKDGQDILALIAEGEKDMIHELAVGWLAFERFCLSRPGIEADTLLSAWRLPGAFEIGEVLNLHKDDPPEPALVQEYFEGLCVLWDTHFGKPKEGTDHGH